MRSQPAGQMGVPHLLWRLVIFKLKMEDENERRPKNVEHLLKYTKTIKTKQLNTQLRNKLFTK